MTYNDGAARIRACRSRRQWGPASVAAHIHELHEPADLVVAVGLEGGVPERSYTAAFEEHCTRCYEVGPFDVSRASTDVFWCAKHA